MAVKRISSLFSMSSLNLSAKSPATPPPEEADRAADDGDGSPSAASLPPALPSAPSKRRSTFKTLTKASPNSRRSVSSPLMASRPAVRVSRSEQNLHTIDTSIHETLSTIESQSPGPAPPPPPPSIPPLTFAQPTSFPAEQLPPGRRPSISTSVYSTEFNAAASPNPLNLSQNTSLVLGQAPSGLQSSRAAKNRHRKSWFPTSRTRTESAVEIDATGGPAVWIFGHSPKLAYDHKILLDAGQVCSSSLADGTIEL